jgi:AraC-like DNA-binding protein
MVRIKNLISQRRELRKKFSQQITLQPKNISITSIDGLFLKKVESAIEKYLSDYDFGVPQLQEVLAMSKTQLHRKIKALTDHAPGEFLRNYRLKRAAQLLEQQGGNITEIAFAVGFGSLSYFTRSFKELFGKSPSEYSQFKKEARQV